MQEDVVAKKMDADTYASISVSSYLLGKYTAVDAAKVGALKQKQQPRSMKKLKFSSRSLANITYSLFSCWAATMRCFLLQAKGGYKPVEIALITSIICFYYNSGGLSIERPFLCNESCLLRKSQWLTQPCARDGCRKISG